MISMAKVKKRVYYHTTTDNISFLKMYQILKDLGIRKNKFFLKIYDTDLIGVDPFDPDLSLEMKSKILREVKINYWYFIREIVRIPVPGGMKRYELNRGNLAISFCILNNMNFAESLPRQNYKTQSVCCAYLWIYNFATKNSEISLINKKYDDSKLNLDRIKKIREILPSYLRLMNERYDTNNLANIESSLNGNKIVAKNSAISEEQADLLGRGCSQPIQWYDEFSFLKYNGIIYTAATLAQSQSALEARSYGKPNHIAITTTPGDLKTAQGVFAKAFFDSAAPFMEEMYDWSLDEIEEYIQKNSRNNFVYIEFSYKQLGRSEEWFRQQCRALNMDRLKINREILLQWTKSSDFSPFNEEDIERLYKKVVDPIATIFINKFYPFTIYKDFDWKKPLFIGIDTASGYERDSSAITICDAETLEVYADFNNNIIDTVELSELVYTLASEFFTRSIIVPERNNNGKSLIDILLRTDVAHKIYFEIKEVKAEKKIEDVRKKQVKKVRTRVYGVNTDSATRPAMIDILRSIINDGEALNSKRIVDDIAGLERKKNGKIEHGELSHDDNLFSYLIIRWLWAYGINLAHFFIYNKKKDITDEETGENLFKKRFMAVSELNKKRDIPKDFMSSEIINEYLEEQNRKLKRDLEEKEDSGVSFIQTIMNFNKW